MCDYEGNSDGCMDYEGDNSEVLAKINAVLSVMENYVSKGFNMGAAEIKITMNTLTEARDLLV